MKKYLLALLLALIMPELTYAQEFDKYFTDETIRLDYVFSGNAQEQHISLDQLIRLPNWAGRRSRLAELPLAGNGDLTVKDSETQTIIYRHSFSSLFQEYIESDEAKTEIQRTYESCFLMPMPKQKVDVEIRLFSSRRNIQASLHHSIDPEDILIRRWNTNHITPHRYILQGDLPEKCIDVAILAEGYTKEEMESFYDDARKTVEAFKKHQVFAKNIDKFNFVAVASESTDSGVSVPRLGDWKNTAFDSHFSTFYSPRYLTTEHVRNIHNALAGIPYEHIIILANTHEYGGGGIYNHYTLTTAHNNNFEPVVVHEFGHSFGGLGDEYFYENDPLATSTYPTDIEPWEPNLTTLNNFDSKWKHLLKKGTPIPTPIEQKDKYPLGVFEGGGYVFHGVFRPADDCRMRTNTCKDFCPACAHAIENIINFYTK